MPPSFPTKSLKTSVTLSTSQELICTIPYRLMERKMQLRSLSLKMYLESQRKGRTLLGNARKEQMWQFILIQPLAEAADKVG